MKLKKLRETAHYLIDKSIASGTKTTYGQSWRNWERFCREFGFNPLHAFREQLLIFYASWRYLSPKKVIGNTIDKEISGILTTCGNKTLIYGDRAKMKVLRRVIAGIKREVGRESTPVNPIRNRLLRKMLSTLDNSSDDIVTRTYMIVMKMYMLRAGETAVKGNTIDETTLRRKNISFKRQDNKLYMSLTLKSGKTNQERKIQIVTCRCLCNNRYLRDLCPVHAMLKMLKLRGKVKPNDFLFKWEDRSILNTSQVAEQLYLALHRCGIYGAKENPAWRPHSYRYGGVTDLRAAEVPDYLIRMMARHAPGSLITFHYTKFTAYEYSDKVYSHL